MRGVVVGSCAHLVNEEGPKRLLNLNSLYSRDNGRFFNFLQRMDYTQDNELWQLLGICTRFPVCHAAMQVVYGGEEREGQSMMEVPHPPKNATEPVFVNLLRSPGIDSQPGGIDSRAP